MAPEREALGQCRSSRTKIHFLLHLGYFRARQRFFRFELPAVRDAVEGRRRRYFEHTAAADLTVSEHTHKRHVEAILGLLPVVRVRLRRAPLARDPCPPGRADLQPAG
ncbi:MAG: DUF4158 domain-containing protein, partial [Thiohalocapsa sp.]